MTASVQINPDNRSWDVVVDCDVLFSGETHAMALILADSINLPDAEPIQCECHAA